MELYDPDALRLLSKSGLGLMAGNPDVDDLGIYGTAGGLLPQNMSGMLPTLNYNKGQFDGCDPISGEVLYDTVAVRQSHLPWSATKKVSFLNGRPADWI